MTFHRSTSAASCVSRRWFNLRLQREEELQQKTKKPIDTNKQKLTCTLIWPTFYVCSLVLCKAIAGTLKIAPRYQLVRSHVRFEVNKTNTIEKTHRTLIWPLIFPDSCVGLQLKKIRCCVPMGIFHMGNSLKQSRATQPKLMTSLVYAVFLCDRTAGCVAYSFTTDGYGIFNMRTHLGACRTYESGSGTNKSAQRGRDRKTAPHPAPARGSNPGSSDLNSRSL